MKRCPQCDSLFNDEEHFCELDGTPLTDADPPITSRVVPPAPRPQDNKGVLIIGGLAGVIVGMLLFLLYFALTWEKPKEETSQSNSTSSSIVTQPQLTPPPQARPEVSPSPSVEASPSPSVEPSPSVQPSPARIEVSSNPISTAAGGRTGPVIIRLQNGLNIEAEEAWQTGEGIWYRKSGVVSLLDPSSVKAIEKVPKPSPQPSAESSKPPQ